MYKYTRLVRRAKEKVQGIVKHKLNKRKLKYEHVPWLLWLEVTSRCNANCVFCGRSDVHQPVMDMDFEMFKQIIDAAPFASQIHTQGFGEPLLWPHLVEGVAYAKKKGLRVVFYTNGALLTDDLAIRLLKAGVDQIRFSIDEMTAEDYEPMRRGLKFDTVLKNIENFQRRKNEGNYNTETEVSMTIVRENQARVPEIVKFWEERVDLVVTNPEINIAGYKEVKENPITTYKPIKCENPYTQLVVKSNGDVLLCCVDWFHNYVIGNIKDRPITTESILELYNSPKYNYLRRGLETGINIPYKCLSCKGIIPPKRYD